MFEDQRKQTEGKNEKGQFAAGNKYWRQRDRSGPRMIFETPEELQEACFRYFDWADENPIWEDKVFGSGFRARLAHARAMTIRGLCVFIGISKRTWDEYRNRDAFKDVCEVAEDIMFEQKFAGAAAGVFNGNIIARELGLSDKKEIEGELIVEVIDSYAEDPDPE